MAEAAARAKQPSHPQTAHPTQPPGPKVEEKTAERPDSNDSAVATTYILVAREAVDPLTLALDAEQRLEQSNPAEAAVEAIEIAAPPQVPANDQLFAVSDLSFAARVSGKDGVALGELSGKDGVAAGDSKDDATGTDTPGLMETIDSGIGPELQAPPRTEAGPKPLADAHVAARNYQAAAGRDERLSREPLPAGAEEEGSHDTGAAVRAGATTSSFQMPAPARTVAAEVTPHTVNHIEQIRGPENPVTETTISREPLRDLSLRISEAGHESIDVKIVERGGDIRVAVRTSDIDLSHNLRNGLSDLVARLDRIGYQAETRRPAETAGSGAEHSNWRGSGGDAQARHGNAGSSSGSSHGHHQERQPRPQPQWLEEMQQGLTSSERVQFPWLRP